MKRCHMAFCGRLTDRSFYVNRIAGEWPTCGHHGKVTIKALMELFKGYGIYSRKDDGK